MSKDFIFGFLFCMVSDIFFSIANFFVQKAFLLRDLRRKGVN